MTASGHDTMSLVFSFFKDWFLQLLSNMKKVYSPLVQSLNKGDDLTAISELKYYINCESCELISGTIIDGLKDLKN